MNAFHYERYRLPNLHNPFCFFRAALFSPILRRLFAAAYLLILVQRLSSPAIDINEQARVCDKANMKRRKRCLYASPKGERRKEHSGCYRLMYRNTLVYLLARFIMDKPRHSAIWTNCSTKLRKTIISRIIEEKIFAAIHSVNHREMQKRNGKII